MSLRTCEKRFPPRCSGQGTVEFALAMTLMMAFVLFFFQLSLVFAFGNYAHYATFMSARALLSAGADPGDQETRAENVITLTLKKANSPGVERLPTIAKSQGGGAVPGMDIDLSNFGSDPTNYSWAQGSPIYIYEPCVSHADGAWGRP